MSSGGVQVGVRRGMDLPAARLAQVRQQSDPLCMLVCEPDPDVLEVLMESLSGTNVKIVSSSDGARALLDAGLTSPELLLLSAETPIVGTVDVIRTIRQVSSSYVIVGAAEGQAGLVSAAVEVGADRVMAVPYPLADLKAVMLTLRSRLDLDSVLVRAGDLTVDPLAYEVRLGGRLIPMAVRELEVLVYLIRHHDRVVSVNELQEALWGGEPLSPRSNAVAVTVLHLRSRLTQRNGQEIIRTIRRRGYRFYPPEGASLVGATAQPSL